ncbi:sigma-70 family RNA polymerase sigma factor [Rhodococcus rhodochrous]|uniref:sigma-70 family RNA polymerase sigma factor n=1 Tax=Rhodococcus rhodochrous TaxID=1829 RepID=UPI001E4AD58D|nr:sigma-70 family RNA polymerase sigma factor [Rhodococcus rhodochrous]MCD2098287.1 sigma-70 family RNA polymerase sigma factor [Rhodococcus rhodochrous]MCD2122444.1 sigma-70 family RNA polymerase sigma factor [Rhodococcus rhodochrous]MCQ4134158.1 sigma-70 family RNA polymerase sigma factor [Rhodococcus rhodochrous]MDJ0019277.1 sigma-70 family RNA polymerase sigma factor [Rhodococcus rhodochrous]
MLDESTQKTFEENRTHLLSVAYRLTGSIADAEDAVQDAWLRLAGADVSEVRDLRAWLTTVVGRLCLDRLRSAAVRRETYVGQWLPEPIVAPLGSPAPPDPLDEIVRDEDNRLAALVVLDSLTPAQRVAFVLHDAFDIPFDDIARILDVAVPTARQLASRARRTVSAVPPPSSPAEHEEAVGRLVAAFAGADLDAVVAALHPDARMIGDAGGTTRTALNVVVGAEKVARFILGLLRLYGAEALTAFEPVLVNGELGLLNRGRPAENGRPGFPPRVTAWTVRDGRIWAAYDIANPEKLRRGVLLPDGIFD